MIDRARLSALRADEERRFADTHPRSGELSERAGGSLLAGVPMPWMTRWAGLVPAVPRARVGSAARRRRRRGVRRPLPRRHRRHDRSRACRRWPRPSPHAPPPGSPRCCPPTTRSGSAQELSRRFGLPQWQFAMTATDANRFVLRFARHLTGRPRIAVMDWCYHGTVDEAFATLDGERVVPRPGLLGRAGRRRRDHRRAPVQRRRGARPAPGRGRRRLPADGAGADQHRHRAPRRRLPRRGPRDHPSARRPARHRRDPHAVRGAGRRARPRGASTPTCWWSASRSPAACRSRRTA